MINGSCKQWDIKTVLLAVCVLDGITTIMDDSKIV